MRIGRFALPYGGGSDPDPATYCPTNGFYDPDDPDSGVIWNPINPADGWVLLAEFDTNSPSSATFDPAIVSTFSQVAWDLGDGSIIKLSAISYYYYDSTTKKIKLYGKNTGGISSFDANNDHIVGEIDLSHYAFKTCASWVLYGNSALTDIVFPSEVTASVTQISILSCNITGTLDLSGIDTFSSCYFVIESHPNLTGFTFPSSISGTIASLSLSFLTGINGTLDVSVYDTFTSTAGLVFIGNTNLTGLTFANPITGTFGTLYLYNNKITGTLDLSMFGAFTANGDLRLFGNTLMTAITWASSITGTFSNIRIYSTGITGTLDLSKFSAFTSAAYLQLYSNASMTAITWASSITGTFTEIAIYSTGITGTLDVSKFTTFASAGASLKLHSNTSLTAITVPSSIITGVVKFLAIYGNTSLGYVDLTKYPTGIASLDWQLQNNGWSAAIVNHVLVDIDSISAGGYTGRTINIGGTNADPDTTSGGYDGTAARNSLISKGFTVTIT